MADTSASPPPQVRDTTHKSRPEKPDEAKFKLGLPELEKAHIINTEKLKALRAKSEAVRSNKDDPSRKRFDELVTDQKSIRQQQQTNKSSRGVQKEKYDLGEAQLKKMISEQKDARARLPYKNVEELDAHIDRLTKQVDSGSMKLVDEKKALSEVSSLRKQRKTFSGFEEMQKRIDQKKAELAEMKRAFDNPEARALSQRYEDNQKELDEIKAARETSNKNLEALRAEREKLEQAQKASWAAIKDFKDKYYQAKKEYKEYEDMLYQQRRERQKAERAAFEREKREKVAREKLAEASAPAYVEDIRRAEGLLLHFDPSAAVQASGKGPGKFAATAQRTVQETEIKGMRVMKKDDEDFFVGGGGKKKKGGKKTSDMSGKMNLNYGIIEELSKVGVEPPATQADVPTVIEKLKEKIAFWKSDQDRQTKVNIAAAQKQIDELEKHTSEESTSTTTQKANGRREAKGKKVASKDAGVNGEVSTEGGMTQQNEAIADATEEVKKAKIEDKENEAVEA